MSTSGSTSPTPACLMLPPRIEFAVRRVILHYWSKEQQDYAQLPEQEQLGHIFLTLRLLDDWLFEQIRV